MSGNANRDSSCAGKFNSTSEDERLHELIRLTGIPLNSKPSALELERAIEQFRQRRRADLMHFLARVIARDIREDSLARIGG